MKKLLFGVLLCTFMIPAAAQQVQYVTDVLYVPMRSGAGNQFRIINSRIKSGTRMTVIDDAGQPDWTHIRTPSGVEGYLPSQYLIDSPTARQQLDSAEERLASALSRTEQLESQLTELTAEHELLATESRSAEQSRNAIAEELRNLKVLSADAVNLSHRYKDLLAQYDLIQTDYDAVRAENDRLKGEKTVNQWLFGAGLVVLGMFLMLILPALKPKKRNSEWRD